MPGYELKPAFQIQQRRTGIRWPNNRKIALLFMQLLRYFLVNINGGMQQSNNRGEANFRGKNG